MSYYKNISLTDRRQWFFKNSLFYIANIDVNKQNHWRRQL